MSCVLVIRSVSMAFTVLVLSVAVTSAQPDPRQMSGLPLPSGDLPDGTVTIRVVRGQLSNNVAGQPVELAVAGEVRTGRTDENGRASFSGIPAGALVTARTTLDGVMLGSQEFPMPPSGGVRMMLVGEAGGGGGQGTAPPPQPVAGQVSLGPSSRFAIELGEDGIQVYSLLDVFNPRPTPVAPAGPLVFELPSNAQGTSVLEGSSRQAVAAGPRVTVTGPFPSGSTPVQFAYQLPYRSDSLRATVKLPAALTALTVIVQQTGNVRLSSPQLANLREQSGDGGLRFIVAEGPGLASGETVDLQLSGLPHHSPVGRNVALATAAGILVIGAWAAVGTRTRRADRASLLQRREAIFADLVRLEHRRRNGTLPPDEYGAERRLLVNELEEIYATLDGGVPPKADSGRRPAAAV